MVLTPEDALFTFVDTEMDVLVMGNYIVYKK
jgi:predicted NodU family carbamoyl transferase